ncbi:MAG: UPF0149 family protein [Woeseia sp.]
MEHTTDYNALAEALRRAGSNRDAAQAHGLLCGRLAATGGSSGAGWLDVVLEDVAPDNALRRECEAMLNTLYQSSYQQLAQRLSEFTLLLPDDDDPADVRTDALARWCEGFLHGLVTGQSDARLRERLAAEPLSDMIRDLLQITQATADTDDDAETNEQAYTELVEYVRVAAQLAYEELVDLRPPTAAEKAGPARAH